MDHHYGFLKNMLVLLVIGVWMIVLQNAGIIPQLRPNKVQSDEPLNIKGTVDVENTVFIKGRVDANLESINGYSKFYKDPRTGDYYVIPVTDPYE